MTTTQSPTTTTIAAGDEQISHWIDWLPIVARLMVAAGLLVGIVGRRRR